MTILLIGGHGNIGKGLCMTNLGNEFVPTSRTNKAMIQLDPLDLDDLKATLDSHNYAAVVLLSACSKLDYCQQYPFESWNINVRMPSVIAKLTNQLGHKFVSFSTEYVYDGTLNHPKTESSQNISPISRYAYQKLLCEQYVLDNNPNALVLRLPKVYNYKYKGNLLTDSILTMNNLNSEQGLLAEDQLFSPISCDCLASILLKAIKINVAGVFNCGGSEIISRYDFVRIVADQLSLSFAYEKGKLHEITGANDLPCNTSMDSTALHELTGCRPMSILNYVQKHERALKCLTATI